MSPLHMYMYVIIFLFIYMKKTCHGGPQSWYWSRLDSNSDVKYTAPSTSYLILDMPSSAKDRSEGFVFRYLVDFLSPVDGITLKFQVWEETNTNDTFIFRGENVFENVKSNGQIELSPNDADQLIVRKNYTLGLYVDGSSHIPYNIKKCSQLMRVYSGTSPMIGQEYDFDEYAIDNDMHSCMDFAITIVIEEVDFSCKIVELKSINDEVLLVPPNYNGQHLQHCWVLRMQRPCDSSYRSRVVPSVKLFTEGNDYSRIAQDDVKIREGGTALDSTIGIKCDGSLFHHQSNVIYITAYRDGNELRVEFLVDPDHNYFRDDFNYCDGEYKPRPVNERFIIAISAGIACSFLVIFISVIVCCVLACKWGKVKTTLQTPGTTHTGGATA